MDVSDRARVQKSIQSLLSQGESIDILINNAGGGKVTPIFEDSDDRDFHDMFHVNVLGVWICSFESISDQMTKTLVGELSPHHIRINCINPGLFHTPLTNYKLDTPSKRQEMLDLMPLGYIPNPEDLDAAILYFASNKASQVPFSLLMVVSAG
ncbi:L-xylulose reductase-like, partial [Stylophora pistillata]|uniref:L-xylulose reductase-like n=1 Tax=Stylophora pistillata TaxID=50429 RepID=UPI000C03CADC